MHGLTLFCTKEVHFRIIDMTEHFHLDFSCIPLSPNICMTIEFPSLALKPKVELKVWFQLHTQHVCSSAM